LQASEDTTTKKEGADTTQNLQAVPTEEGLLPSSNDWKTFE